MWARRPPAWAASSRARRACRLLGSAGIPPRYPATTARIHARNRRAQCRSAGPPRRLSPGIRQCRECCCIVDGEAIVETLWATIHQPAAGQEFRSVDLCIAPSAGAGAQLEIVTIAVHLCQMIDEVRL